MEKLCRIKRRFSRFSVQIYINTSVQNQTDSGNHHWSNKISEGGKNPCKRCRKCTNVQHDFTII